MAQSAGDLQQAAVFAATLSLGEVESDPPIFGFPRPSFPLGLAGVALHFAQADARAAARRWINP
jgi:hypothetical protein